jgi:plasmid stabilization system protein ParE
MGFDILVKEEAYEDIEIAIDFYFDKSYSAAKVFQSDLSRGFSILEQNPFFRKIHKDFRMLPLSKFPYVLIFKVFEENNSVVVFSVFHTSKNPNKLPGY